LPNLIHVQNESNFPFIANIFTIFNFDQSLQAFSCGIVVFGGEAGTIFPLCDFCHQLYQRFVSS